MNFIMSRANALLADLFSRRGRMSAERFRTAYFANVAILVVASALPFLVPPLISSNLYFLCMGLTFFSVYNVATKRHRDTLPLHIAPKNPFRILPSNPYADQSTPGSLCGVGFVFMSFSPFMLLHFELGKVALQGCAVCFIFGSVATLATRFLWVAPSYPRTNQYGPNPHEVPQ
ncbi:MAG: hypothetical protein R8G34_19835 [Paracoccaceae bacterium]|nr:hypothetical protein [Paracoccaceae bacterium]